MADCEHLAECMFFNDKMAGMPATAELMKDKYCRSDNTKCARYVVSQKLGKRNVPPDLYPRNMERALRMISSE